MLARAEPSLDLGIAQVWVALDEGSSGAEESGNLFVCHIFSAKSPHDSGYLNVKKYCVPSGDESIWLPPSKRATSISIH